MEASRALTRVTWVLPCCSTGGVSYGSSGIATTMQVQFVKTYWKIFKEDRKTVTYQISIKKLKKLEEKATSLVPKGLTGRLRAQFDGIFRGWLNTASVWVLVVCRLRLESNMTATKLKVASDRGNDHISGPRSTYWSPGGSIWWN